jgi:hypothetical protein
MGIYLPNWFVKKTMLIRHVLLGSAVPGFTKWVDFIIVVEVISYFPTYGGLVHHGPCYIANNNPSLALPK